MRRLLLALIGTVAAGGLIATQAGAASTYCTPTGHYWYSAKLVRGAVMLRFDTFSFSDPVKTCVRSPRAGHRR
ncbi:MAG TPA: hypothetical protein VF526_08250 [Solirubrobacteraceae bacterium]|jgi:hypothetical protein